MIAGRPQVGGVAIAEGKTTASISSRVGNSNVPANAPTSSRVKNIVETIEKEGVKVKVNQRNAATAQEGNVTLSVGGDARVNLRIETHPLKPNGPPVRHANVDVIRTVRGKKRVVEKTHITE